MFTYADGRPIRPEYLTHRFNTLVREFDLPPIRLHDLRHGAATLALASHTDLKVIQQMLGHSSIVTTADTYTSVLPETAHRAAQATADMVIKAARSAPGSRLGGTVVPHVPAAVTASGYCQMWVPAVQKAITQALPNELRGALSGGRAPARDPGMPHPCPTTTKAV
jgi:hypothetical protein